MARKRQPPRKRRGHATELPVFLQGACEFSDDPRGLDNAVWVCEAIKRDLIGGGGPLGNLWQELREAVAAAIAETKHDKKSGRPRIEGDWLLLFVGYVMSKQPEMMEFWKNGAFDRFFEIAGFDLEHRPGYGTLYNRFTELERPEIVALIGAFADRIIQNAMEHDPEIGENVHIDATGYDSRAVPHHACDDPETCDECKGNRTPEVTSSSSKTVKQSRWNEQEQPPEMALRHPTAARTVELRPDAKRGEFKKVIKLHNGHKWGLHDAGAAMRSYKNPDGATEDFWCGGYDIIAVDGKYGGKLQGVIAPNDRQECNLYYPLMRRLHNTLGRWPGAVTADAGHAIKKTFRFNTRRGIASVFVFRRQGAEETREDLRSVEIDEHGVCRCDYCGGETEQVRFELRKSGSTVEPTFHVKCKLGLTDDCKRIRIKHPEELPNGWRLLVPIPRTSERYFALKAAHKNMEGVFRHQRQRYRTIGNDETGKIKRFGTEAHQLRCEIARLIEWYRISIRFGWIGSERRYRKITTMVRRGHHTLRSVMNARQRRGLSLPYGPQAHRLGFAPTPDVPPPRPVKT